MITIGSYVRDRTPKMAWLATKILRDVYQFVQYQPGLLLEEIELKIVLIS